MSWRERYQAAGFGIRGQAHAILSMLGMGRNAPVLDLHRVIKPHP